VWYAYIIRSQVSPNKEYTGATADLKQWLATSPYFPLATSLGRPHPFQ
jgi:hypothetical protein